MSKDNVERSFFYEKVNTETCKKEKEATKNN